MEWLRSRFEGGPVAKRDESFRTWIGVALILFALNAFSLNLGCISPIFSCICGIFALIGTAFLYMPSHAEISKNQDLVAGTVLALASFTVLLATSRVELWLLCLPIFISGLDLVLRSWGAQVRELAPLSLSSAIYAGFYIIAIHFPQLWIGVSSFSVAFSGFIGHVARVPLALGPSVSGTWILLTFLFSAITFFLLSEKRRTASWKELLFLTVGLGAAHVIYITLQTTGWMTGERSIQSIYMLFFLFLIPFVAFARKFCLKNTPIGHFIPEGGGRAILGAIFVSFVLMSLFPSFYDGCGGKVVIYERECEMNFGIPEFPDENEPFEPRSGFSIGALALYLETTGYDVEDLNGANSHTLKEALEDTDILVMMNLKSPLDPQDLEAVWSFVESGGGLLIFGEHTRMFVNDDDFESGKDYLNDVLEPTGIKINPDTADYFPENWRYASTTLPHPVTRSLGFEITTSSVGASLDLKGTSRPLILGRYAFSDDPNSKGPGHLGNRSYEKGERLGDLVIAASNRYGDGKVLVFGDTSYVFDPSIPQRYKLVDDMFSWLMSDEIGYQARILPWVALLVLGILAIFYISGWPNLTRYTVGFQISISTAVFLSLIFSGSLNGFFVETPEKKGDIAWIDHSHVNQFDLIGYEPSSIEGLTTNMMRNGYMPLLLEDDDFSGLSKGDVFVIIGPTKRYTSSEASLLKSFVEKGGLLIISAGYKNRVPLETVLESFGLQIGKTPLGSPPWIVETHGQAGGKVSSEDLRNYWHKPKFMEAYPVLAGGNFEPITWLEYEGNFYNLIAAKAYGKGAVVLIGDSHFLLNENLEYLTQGSGRETKEHYQLQWLGNIELLREMITKYGGKA